MIAIFKREFKSQFLNMTGFLFAALLLLFVGIFATQFHLLGGYASFEHTLQSTCTILLLGIPLLTMRSIPEDKRTKTDRLLYSLPLKLSQIILGKYFAMLAVFAIPTVILSLYPLIFSTFGDVNLRSAYACVLAFFLLGAALIALSLFLSTLADSQIVAAILGFGALFLLYILRSVSTMIPTTPLVSAACLCVLGVLAALLAYYLTRNVPITCAVGAILILPIALIYWISASVFENLFPSLLSKLAIFNRLEPFIYGVFDISTLVFYLSFSAFFIVLTVLAAEKKRWN